MSAIMKASEVVAVRPVQKALVAFPTLGDVAHDGAEERHAIVSPNRKRQVDRHLRAIPAPCRNFDGPARQSCFSTRHDTRKTGVMRATKRLWNDDIDRLMIQFFLAVSQEQRSSAVRELDLATLVDNHKGKPGCFGEPCQM